MIETMGEQDRSLLVFGLRPGVRDDLEPIIGGPGAPLLESNNDGVQEDSGGNENDGYVGDSRHCDHRGHAWSVACGLH